MRIRIDQAPIPGVTLTCKSLTVADRDEVVRHVGRMFDRVYAAYGAAGTPAGTPMAWYDDGDDGDGGEGQMTFGAGLDTPLAEPAAFGLTNVTLAGSPRGWSATYRGPLSGILDAWQELRDQIAAAGDTPTGIFREVYLEPSRDFAADWVIELQQPVR
jgi:hypothetical protein